MNGKSEQESQLPWTGERYVPYLTGQIQLEHVHRYLLAREYARDKDVLDIACGEGYGSAILAETARSVVGVDLATEAVKHAAIRYRRDKVGFKQGSCAQIPLNDDSIDLVVSFETIEHHDEHRRMLAEIKRVLRPDGVLIISSPDKKEYSILPNYRNPFHVRELFKEEFEDLIRAYFKNLALMAQRIVYGSGVFPEAGAFRVIDYDIRDTGCASPGLARSRYLVAVASDEVLPTLSGGLLEQPVEDSEIVKSYADEHEKRSDLIKQLEDKAGKLGEQLRIQASESEGKVRKLEDQVRVLTSESAVMVREFEDRLHSQAAEFAAKVRELEDRLRSEVAESAATVHELEARLRSQASQSAAKVSKLEKEVEHLYLTRFEAERLCRSMSTSLSWRLTRPFRVLRDGDAVAMILKKVAERNNLPAKGEPGCLEPAIKTDPEPEDRLELSDQSHPLKQVPSAADFWISPVEPGRGVGRPAGRDLHPLFDVDWYLSENPDVAEAGVEPLRHYLESGWKEGRSPHPLFDVRYYFSQAPGLAETAGEPVAHFLRIGARQGLKPNPIFDPAWYAGFNRRSMSPGENALTHYVTRGWKEGCDPHPSFSTSLYLEANPEIRSGNEDPLVHYLRRSRSESVHLMPEIRQESLDAGTRPPEVNVKAIALYLPQFHRIPENDAWWGEGFTEWTNVRRGKPQFWGHYQPHVPHPDIGYYDLTDADVIEKQVQVARQYGIHGFCFYYYWFNGRRLLEMPTDRFLSSDKPDFPFCFCWANENWTRRWDGEEREVLMRQEYSYESEERFIREILPALRDRRYLRINGRPLLAVYRPGSLPDPRATFAHWREVCRKEGLGEIYLAGFKAFDFQDPEPFGMDAAVEFPPHQCTVAKRQREDLPVFNDFCGSIFDYRQVAENLLNQPTGNSILFRGVMPGWDNTSRMQKRGTVWAHSDPQLYCRWLHRAVLETRRHANPDERLIFINSWNEWAEGAHLEPDERYGYAWLNATRLALEAGSAGRDAGGNPDEPYVLVLSHDAALAGAQVLLLNLLRQWKRQRPFAVRIICAETGELRGEFEECFPTLVLADFAGEAEQDRALAGFLQGSPRVIYSSTVVNGPLLARLRPLGVKIVTHSHELQNAIERWAPGEIMAATLKHSDFFLAGSAKVAENLSATHGVPKDRLGIINDFIEPWGQEREPDAAAKAAMRRELGLGDQDVAIFGCGTTDWRKGPDLFVEIARLACSRDARLKFVWIGGDPAPFMEQVRSAGLERRILFVGNRRESRRYYYAGHIFLLSSREDPCPLVALEAADAGLPVVCFAGAGDIPGFVGEVCGVVVPYEDVGAAAQAVVRLAGDARLRCVQGEEGRRRAMERHSSVSAAFQIQALLDRLAHEPQPACARAKPRAEEPLVSVIVPNYNHGKYLPDRLRSIAAQTYQNMEIILLDDASTDDSRAILQAFTGAERRARFLPNTQNSGSTFKQWRKGLSQARGKYVWIAESDDAAEPAFLATLVEKLEGEPRLSLAYCQLRMISMNGEGLGTPEKPWLSEIDPLRWKTDFVNDGIDEIRRSLVVKNTILNASAVVFRNGEGVADLVDDSMLLCADWLFWMRLLQRGGVAYVADPLSHWRLQSSNVRKRPPGELEWVEGERVLAAAAEILGLSEPERDRILLDFLRKCWKWQVDAASPEGGPATRGSTPASPAEN